MAAGRPYESGRSGVSREVRRYAAAVARRYPWVEAYTPVNEPLTTARFSGLYGFWYPHGRDERTFKDALLDNAAPSCSRCGDQARESNAQLVQTEDLGKTYSTRARLSGALQ